METEPIYTYSDTLRFDVRFVLVNNWADNAEWNWDLDFVF